MRRPSLFATLPVALAVAVAACGGTPGAEKPENKATTPASKVKTSGFESLGPVTLTVISSEGSGGPRNALKALSKSFEKKYPNVTVKISFREELFPRLPELDQAGQARRLQRQPARRVRRQPGLPARRRACEGRPDQA